jgi:hypothetical protein
MGSISTYLVHKSSVPVTVIRPQKMKSVARKRPVHTVPLSKSKSKDQIYINIPSTFTHILLSEKVSNQES